MAFLLKQMTQKKILLPKLLGREMEPIKFGDICQLSVVALTTMKTNPFLRNCLDIGN